eukprot:Sspe_Gene.27672::Locus_12038_Transcript_1_1_Confidence_1.000_Length_2140::g.27672::m.27672
MPRPFLLLLMATVVAADHGRAAEYDYVIVGGGAAGAVAGAVLADEGHTVLVLERGGSDLTNPLTRTASGWPAVINSDAAEKFRFTDGTWGAMGNTLGGGASVNGGLVINETCAWYTEHFGSVLDCDAMYKSYLWVQEQLAVPLQPSPVLNTAWQAALTSTGISPPFGPSLEWKYGSFVPYSTINTSAAGWPRVGPAALLHRRELLSNLKVETHALVHRVHFNGTRAVGVWVEDEYKLGPRRSPKLVTATKGVVLACGTLRTPQMLQLSGVGNATLLRNLGVEVVVDNSEVGRNFVDRNVVTIGLLSKEHVGQSMGYSVGVTDKAFYELEGGGHLISEMSKATMALVKPSERTEAVQRIFEDIFGRTPNTDGLLGELTEVLNNVAQLVGLNRYTMSRGFIVANSTDPATPPLVTANYFSDPADLEVMVDTVLNLVRIAQQAVLAPFRRNKPPLAWNTTLPSWLACLFEDPKDVLPYAALPCPPAKDTAEEWREWILRYSVSSFHYFGTAAVGKVVDPSTFKVMGTEGLYCFDSAALPAPTRVNPQGAIMALAHYGAQQLIGLTS